MTKYGRSFFFFARPKKSSEQKLRKTRLHAYPCTKQKAENWFYMTAFAGIFLHCRWNGNPIEKNAKCKSPQGFPRKKGYTSNVGRKCWVASKVPLHASKLSKHLIVGTKRTSKLSLKVIQNVNVTNGTHFSTSSLWPPRKRKSLNFCAQTRKYSWTQSITLSNHSQIIPFPQHRLTLGIIFVWCVC